jgi:hypothetical protein
MLGMRILGARPRKLDWERKSAICSGDKLSWASLSSLLVVQKTSVDADSMK